MELSPQDVHSVLKRYGIAYTVYEHLPLFTCEDAEVAYSTLPAFGECKNLFLVDKQGVFWLIVARYKTTIKIRKLARKVGTQELRFATPEDLYRYLGVTPGSVTPFALLATTARSVRVVVDATIFDEVLVGFHPLVNTATMVIRSSDLAIFLQQCGIAFETVDFATLE